MTWTRTILVALVAYLLSVVGDVKSMTSDNSRPKTPVHFGLDVVAAGHARVLRSMGYGWARVPILASSVAVFAFSLWACVTVGNTSSTTLRTANSQLL